MLVLLTNHNLMSNRCVQDGNHDLPPPPKLFQCLVFQISVSIIIQFVKPEPEGPLHSLVSFLIFHIQLITTLCSLLSLRMLLHIPVYFIMIISTLGPGYHCLPPETTEIISIWDLCSFWSPVIYSLCSATALIISALNLTLSRTIIHT